MDHESGRAQRLAVQIYLLQHLMARATIEGNPAELHRLADLVEIYTIMITRLWPWFVHELIRGWSAHLSNSPHQQ